MPSTPWLTAASHASRTTSSSLASLEAAWATRLLGLRQVVPIHYETFPVLTGTPADFERELANLGVDCEVLAVQPGESL